MTLYVEIKLIKAVTLGPQYMLEINLKFRLMEMYSTGKAFQRMTSCILQTLHPRNTLVIVGWPEGQEILTLIVKINYFHRIIYKQTTH